MSLPSPASRAVGLSIFPVHASERAPSLSHLAQGFFNFLQVFRFPAKCAVFRLFRP